MNDPSAGLTTRQQHVGFGVHAWGEAACPACTATRAQSRAYGRLIRLHPEEYLRLYGEAYGEALAEVAEESRLANSSSLNGLDTWDF